MCWGGIFFPVKDPVVVLPLPDCSLFSGETTRIFAGHTGAVNTIDLSSDGLTAVTGADDMLVRLWSVASGAGGSHPGCGVSQPGDRNHGRGEHPVKFLTQA